MSDLEPPFLIPNKEVKQVSANDTHSKAELGKVGHSQGILLEVVPTDEIVGIQLLISAKDVQHEPYSNRTEKANAKRWRIIYS